MSRDETSEMEQKKASQKELARKLRREAYQRAVEFKKNDPREIARKVKAKEQRKALYQKAKERHKAAKKAAKEHADLNENIMKASEMPLDSRPMAELINLDSYRSRKKSKI